MNFEYENKRLFFKKSFIAEFKFNIKKMLEIESNRCLIILQLPSSISGEVNIFLVGNWGEYIWVLPEIDYANESPPFCIDIELEMNNLRAYFSDGNSVLIDIKTGHILGYK